MNLTGPERARVADGRMHAMTQTVSRAARPNAGDGRVGNSLLLVHLAGLAMQTGTAAYLDYWPAKANRWFGSRIGGESAVYTRIAKIVEIVVRATG
eukprot:COSAG02_NODE_5592_length_4206_cov_2.462381_1_plen_96_part_00